MYMIKSRRCNMELCKRLNRNAVLCVSCRIPEISEDAGAARFSVGIRDESCLDLAHVRAIDNGLLRNDLITRTLSHGVRPDILYACVRSSRLGRKRGRQMR